MAAVTIKLYALLSQYLPPGAKENKAVIEVADDATVGAVIAALGLPLGHCHLVLLNGVFVPPDGRAATPVKDGDALAIWPPVAGG
jgi:sulfur carrier protein ThiS